MRCDGGSSNSRCFWFLLVVCTMGFIVTTPSEARFDVISVESGSRLISLGSGFGFSAGGSLNISIDVKPTTNYKFISLFNNLQWRTAMTEDSDQSCTHAADMRYEFKDSLNLSLTIHDLSFYRIVLINCDRDVLSVQGNATFYNQGDRGQMSLDEIILFPVYAVIFTFYLVITLGVLTFYYKHSNKMILIYKLVIISLLCKSLEAGLNLIYYHSYETSGDTYSGLRQAKELSKTFSETMLLAVIILVSLGWKIMRTHLTIRENQLLYGSCFLFAMFDLLFSLCRYPQNLCSAYMLSFHVVKFLITFGVIVAMNGSIERLRADALEQENPSSVSIQFFPRVSMYQNYRWFCLFYLLAPIGLVFIEFAVLDWIEYWLVIILQQFIYSIVLLYTVHLLRPGKQHLHFVFQSQVTNNGDDENDHSNPLANLPQYAGDYDDEDSSLFSIFFNNADSDDEDGGFSLRSLWPFGHRSSNLLNGREEEEVNAETSSSTATALTMDGDETSSDGSNQFGSLVDVLQDHEREVETAEEESQEEEEDEEEEEEAMMTRRQRSRQASAILESSSQASSGDTEDLE